MSVVAFRDEIMAADTSGECAGRRHPISKLTRNTGFIIGGAGSYPDCVRAAEWVLAGAPLNIPPKWLNYETDNWKPDFCLLGWDGAHLTYWSVSLVPERVSPVVPNMGLFYAIGCGAEAALGAMYMGATAEQAVRAAMHVNVGVWGDVETMRLPRDDRPDQQL